MNKAARIVLYIGTPLFILLGYFISSTVLIPEFRKAHAIDKVKCILESNSECVVSNMSQKELDVLDMSKEQYAKLLDDIIFPNLQKAQLYDLRVTDIQSIDFVHTVNAKSNLLETGNSEYSFSVYFPNNNPTYDHLTHSLVYTMLDIRRVRHGLPAYPSWNRRLFYNNELKKLIPVFNSYGLKGLPNPSHDKLVPWSTYLYQKSLSVEKLKNSEKSLTKPREVNN